MKKTAIIILLLLATATQSYAEIYVYMGKYFASKLSAYPGAVNNYAQWRAGIHVEKTLIDKFMTVFIEDETLMDGNKGIYFTPSSTNFHIGLMFDIELLKIILKHECKHPHEDRVGSFAEEYSLVEFRFMIDR